MKLPIKNNPMIKADIPIKNCSHTAGYGEFKIPKKASLINLMPYIERTTGEMTISTAMKRCILNHPFCMYHLHHIGKRMNCLFYKNLMNHLFKHRI